VTSAIRATAVAIALALGGGESSSEPMRFDRFDARSPAALRAAHAGKAFVLVFWSPSCEPCRDELPLWSSLARRHPGLPIHLVMLPLVEGDEEEAKPILRALAGSGVRTAVATDDVPERIFHAVDPGWRGELPAAFLFDSTHRVERRLGRVAASYLEAWAGARDGI
jgi:thiol-disulfide isomerase/thioredoxin